jgi:uncharacterized OB-fold protein
MKCSRCGERVLPGEIYCDDCLDLIEKQVAEKYPEPKDV